MTSLARGFAYLSLVPFFASCSSPTELPGGSTGSVSTGGAGMPSTSGGAGTPGGGGTNGSMGGSSTTGTPTAGASASAGTSAGGTPPTATGSSGTSMGGAPPQGGTSSAGMGGSGQPTGGATSGAAGVGGSGGASSSGNFDRLAACTGGPYEAPFTGSPSASAIAGSEGDNQSGFQIVEGPAWLDGSLYYSHIISGMGSPSVIKKFTPPSTFEDFVPDAGSNGLAIDLDGNLLAATHDEQNLSKYDATTAMRSTVVDDIGGEKFNSPNDVAVHSSGTIYFTDPNWQNENRPAVSERRLYVVRDGVATAVTTPFNPGGDGGPNGVALSIDEQTLYVSGNGWDANGAPIAAFSLDANGVPMGAESKFPPSANSSVAGDGMTLDCAGNVYATQNGNVQVYGPDGSDLGVISVGDSTNVAFGGADGRTLYITTFAQGKAGLHSIELAVPGLPY